MGTFRQPSQVEKSWASSFFTIEKQTEDIQRNTIPWTFFECLFLESVDEDIISLINIYGTLVVHSYQERFADRLVRNVGHYLFDKFSLI